MKNKLLMKYPSSWWGAKWREALPSGNGFTGAAVYGGIHDETILLTHEELWHREVIAYLPDVSGKLPEIRECLTNRRFNTADRLLAEEFKSLNYYPKVGCPLPLGDLKIRMPVKKGFREYRRMLDMETGEVAVSWKDNDVSFCRKVFVSRPDDLVVMEISSSAPGLVLEIGLELHDLNDIRAASGRISPVPFNVRVESDSTGIIHYGARNDAGIEFGAVARVAPVKDEAFPSANPVLVAHEGGVHVEGASRVMVVVKLFVDERRDAAWLKYTREVNKVEMDYDALLAPHAGEHRELFERMTLDLGADPKDHERSNEELLLDAYQGEASTAFVEKMWAYGRYLLISSSRPGGLPCPLHGKWTGSYSGFWSFHMANENLQMIYWQSLSGQLPETHMPVFDYFDRLMDDFRENAEKIYGCRGIFIPAVTTPASGLLRTTRPHIIHWTGAAAWVGQHYYDYYLYTGDEDFLRNRAFPFLRETALFYEDFFTIGPDGTYQSSPSNSPENTPGNLWDGRGMGEKMETTMNATMDFALAKEVLTHLLEASEILGHDGEETSKWEEMRERIPPYQINSDGAVAEWMHPFYTDNYHHRHQSHIYPVFPGVEVTADSDPDLFKAFQVAITKRLVIGLSEQTGWSLVHMANVYARMKDGNQALDCLNLISRSCVKNNLYTTHNDWRNMGIGVEMPWAPFQIDANMGWPAAIQEMLLFSLPGKISVLPALPDKWIRGSVHGLVARGCVQVSLDWDLDKGELRVELCSSGRAQSVELQHRFGPPRSLDLKAGEVTRIRIEIDPARTASPAVPIS